MRLRMSSMGQDFPRDRFLRTPIGIINMVIKEIDQKEKAEANIQSITNAQLVHVVLQVAHSMMGARGGTPKTKPRDYLPFPDWEPESDNRPGIDVITKEILVSLYKQRQIPVHVFSILMSPPEE